MELAVWRWLCSEDDHGLLQRQRIPEVAIFHGYRLDSWYHSVAGGLVARRRHAASIPNLLQRLLSLASPGGDGPAPDAPVAILRQRSEHGIPKLGVPAGLPTARVLTAKELSELLWRVLDAVEPDIEEPGISATSGVWTLQSFIEPCYNVRLLCLYSCDAHMEERSDVFCRPFSKVYPTRLNTLANNAVPSLEETASGAADVSPHLVDHHRAALESKTMSVVRSAHRFHSIDLEGLVLEFIVDSEGKVVLHGCLAASICNKQDARKFRAPGWSKGPSLASRAEMPRVYDVPHVWGGGNGDGHFSADPQRTFSRKGTTIEQEVDEAEKISQSDYRLLLEFWNGESFMGEALTPCPSSSTALAWSVDELRTLSIRPAGMQPPQRPDGRKLLADPTFPAGTAVVALRWASGPSSGTGPPVLCFRLGRAENLPEGFPLPNSEAGESGVHAVLWLRKPTDGEYKPVWSSAKSSYTEESLDGKLTSVHVWNGESVELSFPELAAHTPDRTDKVNFTTESPPPAPAPASPRGSLTSVHDHVCGAELNTHWGMSEADGTMRAHILASQVLQRMSLERSNRSGMMKKLAQHVCSFHSMQEDWQTLLQDAKAKKADLEAQLRNQEAALREAQQDLEQQRQAQDDQLATACRRLCGEADEHRARHFADSSKLAASQERLRERSAESAALEELRAQLEGSLDRSKRKLEELLAAHAQMQRDLEAVRITHAVTNEAELGAAQNKVDEIMVNVQHGQETLESTRGQLQDVRKHLTDERSHILKLEDFIRRVALQKNSTLRVGGGFLLENKAQQEAQAILEELRLL
eukprot:TRINITY_DN41322_c0_g1_i1.p1 TRINITY_DN41322_c0_g1~~TRINITY_DN41322_c0_g1_i1.p1  ORF type:complete len:819 (+),score=139.34 TRINITY_DN41322_c0_g1_i1:26-2458(+)